MFKFPQPAYNLPGMVPGAGLNAIPYTPNTVHFNGTNVYLIKSTEFTGLSDGKEGTFSGWFDFTGRDGEQQIFLRNNSGFFFAEKSGANTILFKGFESDATPNMVIESTSTFTASDGWLHTLLAWNLATPEVHLYIDDVDDIDAGSTVAVNADIDYTRGGWGVGSLDVPAPDFELQGDCADLWWNPSFIDITQKVNRRKFINSGGKPVDLGANGELPLGSTPMVFLSGDTSTWHTNLGTGGGFTENGALTDGSSNP